MVTISEAQRAAHGAASRFDHCTQLDRTVKMALQFLVPKDSVVAAIGSYGFHDLAPSASPVLYVEAPTQHLQFVQAHLQHALPGVEFVVGGRHVKLVHVGARLLWGHQPLPPVRREPAAIREWARKRMDIMGAETIHSGLAAWHAVRWILCMAGTPIEPLQLVPVADLLMAAQTLQLPDFDAPSLLGYRELMAVAGDAVQMVYDSCDVSKSADSLRCWLLEVPDGEPEPEDAANDLQPLL